MTSGRARRLVLISGAVASGKTTTARALAAQARASGHVVASIDMDEMIAIVAGADWSKIGHADREQACHVTGSLVQSLFDDGTRLVVIAGSTLSNSEWDDVTKHLNASPEITYVLLRVSVEESVRRAQADAGRIGTKDPERVAELAAAIDWAKVRRPDVEIDTEGMAAAVVVTQLTHRLNLSP
jgi:shikimate kinase